MYNIMVSVSNGEVMKTIDLRICEKEGDAGYRPYQLDIKAAQGLISALTQAISFIEQDRFPPLTIQVE